MTSLYNWDFDSKYSFFINTQQEVKLLFERTFRRFCHKLWNISEKSFPFVYCSTNLNVFVVCLALFSAHWDTPRQVIGVSSLHHSLSDPSIALTSPPTPELVSIEVKNIFLFTKHSLVSRIAINYRQIPALKAIAVRSEQTICISFCDSSMNLFCLRTISLYVLLELIVPIGCDTWITVWNKLDVPIEVVCKRDGLFKRKNFKTKTIEEDERYDIKAWVLYTQWNSIRLVYRLTENFD